MGRNTFGFLAERIGLPCSSATLIASAECSRKRNCELVFIRSCLCTHLASTNRFALVATTAPSNQLCDRRVGSAEPRTELSLLLAVATAGPNCLTTASGS